MNLSKGLSMFSGSRRTARSPVNTRFCEIVTVYDNFLDKSKKSILLIRKVWYTLRLLENGGRVQRPLAGDS